MKIFECQSCAQLLYFENTRCEHCGHALGYLPEHGLLSALVSKDHAWQALADPDNAYFYCANYDHGVCNWLVPVGGETFCIACRLNRTIPSLDDDALRKCWQRVEVAKHRLVYSLLRFALPLRNKVDEPETGLSFDFLSDEPRFREDAKVMTGHARGLITINISEADPVERERFRTKMAEPYRTLLGHFRHESGHYYWERLIRPHPERLSAFRNLFGDETTDYDQALKAHYDWGASPDWQARFISAYASAHPYEDWAETWAHYLHIVDTLETATAFGLQVKLRREAQIGVGFDPYRQGDFDVLIKTWLPLTYAINSINRSMGHGDFYPFVLTPAIMEKMQFIHRVIHPQM